MSRRARRTFTRELKAAAVELARASGKSVGKVANDLDLTETTLREWVRRAIEGQPLVGKTTVSVGEREELLHSTLDYKSPMEYEALPPNAAMAA